MLFRFSRRAEADLRNVAAFIAEDHPTQAVLFVKELRGHCLRLTAFPEAAPLRPELGRGVRLSVFGKYLILYVVHGEFIEVRRIVHGARQPVAAPRAAPAAGCRRRRVRTSDRLGAGSGPPQL